MSAIASFLSACPRCNCLSLVEDAYGPVDECVVCGYFAGETFRCNLPHFGCAYRYPAATRLKDVPKIHEEPDIRDLAAVEAWLQVREKNGFEFPHFVVVDIEGEVHWLRGSPSPWDASGQ